MVLCRELGLFTRAVVAIDGSKFKAVNNRDKNYRGGQARQKLSLRGWVDRLSAMTSNAASASPGRSIPAWCS